MTTVLIVTVAYEGGFYSPDRNERAPIRIYSDRRIRDDIYSRMSGKKWRKRLSRKEYRRVRKAAGTNREAGVV